MEKLKQEFFTNFSDGIDEENGYYDAQFGGQTPYQVWNWFSEKVSRLEPPVKPEIAENDISNWEVYHSNSSDTGICCNYPKAGDESVMIRNKVTNKFSFLLLNR